MGHARSRFGATSQRSLEKLPKVSFSSLKLLEECPLCFWRYLHKQPRPSFPIASALIRMDLLQKTLIDKVIVEGTVPEALSRIPGKFVSLPQSTLTVSIPELSLSLIAKLDALIQAGESFVPLDNKTAGAPKDADALSKYFGLQGSIYNLALQRIGYPVEERSIFCQWFPVLDGNDIRVATEVTSIETPIAKAIEVLERARRILDANRPSGSPGCPYCSWGLGVAINQGKDTA